MAKKKNLKKNKNKKKIGCTVSSTVSTRSDGMHTTLIPKLGQKLRC